ncbi:ATP-binding protein [Aquimarina gracilis]|uniref:ATP-binding protein n=1 Tax=Aquimarina gracilis TaxID=874422 RepID=A0ABU5ZVY6_9FLAO|nr:ATP-binding protein [Aquimarina gracilis]MEB3346018.1 ATP-binding protein [Aquimarina gracilis]
MKLWRVISPHTLIIGGIFYFITISSVFGQTLKTETPTTAKEMDSISQYYVLSGKDSIGISSRLNYINKYLKNVFSYKNDSLFYLGLMRKTLLLGKIKEYDSAIYYTNRLYDIAYKNKDTLYIIKSLTKLGIYHKGNSELTDAFQYYNKTFKLSRDINDSIVAGKSLLQMANIQTFLGDYFGSRTTAIEGVKYLENSSDIRNLAGLYHIISVSNRHQKRFKEAKRYNLLAINLAKDSLSYSLIGSRNILIFENTKALISANEGDYNKALSILDTLVSNPIVKNNKTEYSRVLGNLGFVKWLKNNQDENVEETLYSSLKIRESINDIEGLVTINLYLTKYYLNKDRVKALYHAEESYKNAKIWHSLTSIIEALGYIFQLKDDVTEEAKVFNETYLKLNEINQSNREIYAVTKYENENLTNENLKLEAANAKLAIEKAKEERENIIYLLATLVLVLAGGFIFYLLQQRHKRQRIRDVFNAETRISKKLHDELANDVYHVMTQVQNNRNDQEVLDKLEDIYGRTRDISRENSSFKLGKNYTQELSGMLSSYGSDHTKIIIKDIDDINWSAITPEKKIIIHRIIQELMVNMKKHSQASLVAVTFKKNAKNIEISYADNGIGVIKNDIIYSSGLQNAENRIKTIGGSFIFESEEGKGFKAKINFPN